MKITSITYTATVNLGDYESEKIELTAEVNESDGVHEGGIGNVVEALRVQVDALSLRPGWTGRVRKRWELGLKSNSADPFASFPE